MKIVSNDDTYSDALSTAMVATIPFIMFGTVGSPIVMNIAVAVGVLCGCAFLIRFIITLKKPSAIRDVPMLANLMSLLQIPYVTALSGLVLMQAGYEDVDSILWFALALTLGAPLLLPLAKEEI